MNQSIKNRISVASASSLPLSSSGTPAERRAAVAGEVEWIVYGCRGVYCMLDLMYPLYPLYPHPRPLLADAQRMGLQSDSF